MFIRFKFSIILIAIISLILFACNDRSTTTNASLEATLEMIVNKDEVLQIFYLLQTDDAYTEEFSVKVPVKASPDFQIVNFILPEGIKPKNIRIDFGENPGLDSFKLKEISFTYKDLKLIGDREKYRDWFEFNANIEYDSLNKIYRLNPTNTGYYDPQINGTETLNKRLIKLFPPDINDVF